MLFNSLEFLIFFPIVALAHALSPWRYRWILLLAASYIFYMWWRPEYLLLILASTLVDYVAALWMARQTERRPRMLALGISLCANLGMLFVFKYFNLFGGAVAGIAGVEPPELDWILPVGISFYTFQTLSYTIDVYRGTLKPTRHLGHFALYVAFFPQLVAGPIERASRLLPQFETPRLFDDARAAAGLRQMLWGFFKKIVIADRLAVFVDAVYEAPAYHPGSILALATVFFAFQIYCDFSGYSDIAIGAARIMGYDLMDNFERPYLADSIGDFWHRWHISLSTWFRDYLYISLGGNRVSVPRLYLNMAVVFVVSGLWHGAAWTFVIWGALHAIYMMTGRLTRDVRRDIHDRLGLERIPRIVRGARIAVTFVLVCLAWVFFRASSVDDAFYILFNLTDALTLDAFVEAMSGFDRFEVMVSGVLIMGLMVVQGLAESGRPWTVFAQWPRPARWACYALTLAAICFWGVFGEREFIYFQF